jgi:hypothetical protein
MMPTYKLKFRCPACKYEEEATIEAADEVTARNKTADLDKCCPRQASIKMKIEDLKEK